MSFYRHFGKKKPRCRYCGTFWSKFYRRPSMLFRIYNCITHYRSEIECCYTEAGKFLKKLLLKINWKLIKRLWYFLLLEWRKMIYHWSTDAKFTFFRARKNASDRNISGNFFLQNLHCLSVTEINSITVMKLNNYPLSLLAISSTSIVNSGSWIKCCSSIVPRVLALWVCSQS